MFRSNTANFLFALADASRAASPSNLEISITDARARVVREVERHRRSRSAESRSRPQPMQFFSCQCHPLTFDAVLASRCTIQRSSPSPHFAILDRTREKRVGGGVARSALPPRHLRKTSTTGRRSPLARRAGRRSRFTRWFSLVPLLELTRVPVRGGTHRRACTTTPRLRLAPLSRPSFSV